jgi:sugar O-acyltransferase (sialic acid O-acetyltransferase NeuD family)
VTAGGKVVIFGAGLMGRLMSDYLTADGAWEVAAFAAHERFITTSTFEGRPVVAFEAVERQYPPSAYAMFVALSYAQGNRIRRQAYLDARAKGYRLASFISPHARWIGPPVHGDNVFVAESTFQPRARLGSNVFVFSNNLIGHDAVIGDHCFISSGVTISGNVTVGQACFFGVNSCCRENVHIADGTVVGAGVTLLRSTKPATMYVAPAPKALTLDAGSDDFLVRPKFPLEGT